MTMSTTKSNKIAPEVLMRSMSARTIMFHEMVAETLKVNSTDLKCLDIAMMAGKNLTAGELAELSGLTTGAVTGVIDRLEKANLVRREHDIHDRRRVIIVLTHARDHEFKAIFDPMQQRLADLWTQFTPAEQDVITKFIDRSNQFAYELTLELRSRNK